MLLPRAVSLVLVAVGIGAASAGEDSHVTLSKLEALVTSMADGQSTSRPMPVPANDDVVILEDEEHRRLLRACDCDVYENGATYVTAKCFKKEAGSKKCRSSCPSDYTICDPSGLPAPSPNAIVEDEDEASTYVNAYFQVAAPGVTSYAQLPPSSAFAAYLAKKTGTKLARVQAATSWGASARSGRQLSSGTTAIVHATIYTKNKKQQAEAEATLHATKSMYVDGVAFTVSSLGIEPAVAYPLVCTPEEEAAKAEAIHRRHLDELKQQNLELTKLLQDALQGGSSTCSPELLKQYVLPIANHLGLPVHAPVA